MNLFQTAVLLLLFFFLELQHIHLVVADIGTASSYGPPYTPTRCGGDRRDQFPEGNLFVAVSQGLWDNGAACGRRYRIRCLSGSNNACRGGTVDVRVVDFCPASPCPSTILMSNEAFAAISSSPRTRVNIEYIEI